MKENPALGLTFWGKDPNDFSTSIPPDHPQFLELVVQSLMSVRPRCAVMIKHELGHYITGSETERHSTGFACVRCSKKVRRRKFPKGRVLYSCHCHVAMLGRGATPYADSQEWEFYCQSCTEKQFFLEAQYQSNRQNN
jgi:hypothetical protein